MKKLGVTVSLLLLASACGGSSNSDEQAWIELTAKDMISTEINIDQAECALNKLISKVGFDVARSEFYNDARDQEFMRSTFKSMIEK